MATVPAKYAKCCTCELERDVAQTMVINEQKNQVRCRMCSQLRARLGRITNKNVELNAAYSELSKDERKNLMVDAAYLFFVVTGCSSARPVN